jgi:biotin-dependent carboxylase-like uncharacterized protein
VALTGTSAGLIVVRDGVAQEWTAWRAVDLRRGDVIRVPHFADTAIAYLAIAGGMDLPEDFGSRSTFLRGGFGGFEGRALRAGDGLPLVRETSPEGPCLTLMRPPVFVASPVLRALPGPQADHFTPAALDTFFRKEFTVSREFDRMGMRLEGPVLEHKESADIVSDATIPGAVQIPGSSQPILLLNDCQTTGGYPKIAVVISADLPSAGRLLPGAEVHFRRVTMTDAEEARAETEHRYRRIGADIVPVRAA